MERMYMAWLEKRKNKWVIYDRDGRGKKARVATAYSDRQASRQKLARYEKAKAHGAEGLIDPFEQHKCRPLTEHLSDYVADLRALGRDTKYVYNCEMRLTKLIIACGWRVLTDITADSFGAWRAMPVKQRAAESVDRKIGPRTLNQYLEVLRTFCGWCVKRKRIGSNPIADVEKVEESGDVRRARRALTPEEVSRLLVEVPAHHRSIYLFILGTGLRRQEVEDLQWGDMQLNSPTPFIKLRAKATKSRRADSVPLRSDLASELRKTRGEAGDGDKVFPAVPAMKEHRAYLRAAGIDWKDSAGRRADVHALRHTFGTLLSHTGASPREAMELMRHTDLAMTMKTYTDPRIFNLSGAVERIPLPPLAVPVVALVTGTEGAQEGATATIQGHSTAVTGSSAENTGCSQLLTCGSDRQQKTPSGMDGVQARQVGLEPTTSRLTAISMKILIKVFGPLSEEDRRYTLIAVL
jgi:integrase